MADPALIGAPAPAAEGGMPVCEAPTAPEAAAAAVGPAATGAALAFDSFSPGSATSDIPPDGSATRALSSATEVRARPRPRGAAAGAAATGSPPPGPAPPRPPGRPRPGPPLCLSGT